MDNLYEILDKVGLSEEMSDKSKKLKQIRYILINKYINLMDREENCNDLYNRGLDYISLNTYHRRLTEGLKRIKKYIK